MAKIRLIHTQVHLGDHIINDIEDGTPRRPFGHYTKHPVYVTYHRKYFGVGEVLVDKSQPGYVDLVRTDDVLLSQAHGTIAGLEKGGMISVVDIPEGALAAPTITGVAQDVAGGGDVADDYRVEITGTHFQSLLPDVTSVVLTAGAESVVLSADAILAGAGVVGETSIVILAGVHGFATDGSENITEVSVRANGQLVSSSTITTL